MSSESATRQEITDLRLKEAGWDVADLTQVAQESFIFTSSPNILREDPASSAFREFSDYVLLGKNGNPIPAITVSTAQTIFVQLPNESRT